MNDDAVLDVSSLGDVTPPDVVRRALRRFRRRVFTTGAVVALAGLSLGGGLAWAALVHRTFPERIEDSPGVAVGAVFAAGDTVTILERVARLDEGVGLHLHLATPGAAPGAAYSFQVEGERELYDAGSRKVADFYYVVEPPGDGLVRAKLIVQVGCPASGSPACAEEPQRVDAFTIDLEELGVPDELWRE